VGLATSTVRRRRRVGTQPGDQPESRPAPGSDAGFGTSVVLLLHGIIAAGNSFGAVYDELTAHATVVLPDLLGFGESMYAVGPADTRAHIAAIDAALARLELENRSTIVAGHSMGGTLALRWAAEHTDRVHSVTTFGDHLGAPLYRDRTEADERVAGMGHLEQLHRIHERRSPPAPHRSEVVHPAAGRRRRA